MNLCTIIAKNYLAAARVLGDSLHEHHPEVGFHVLVIDEIAGYIDPGSERFEVLRPQQIGIPDFDGMAGIYQILELSTAVKPWLLRHLLERSDDGVVLYLDPDIRLYDRIDDVFEAVREHGLVLTPHNTEPIPRDGLKPAEEDILIAGAYNLGFIGLGRTEFADFLLDWWSERLERDCVSDPANGLFVDQRWIDLVPGLADDYLLLRDPGFNLAYWNLATRKVVKDDAGGFRVNDAPLRMFHFSGFDPKRPHMLSKHQDRIRLPDEPALAELCAGYADALWAAGHEQASPWPYSYDETHSGIALTPVHRAAYRKGTLEGDVEGSLFTAEGERAYVDWCNGPAEHGGGSQGVTRFLEEVYGSRPDLQLIYRDLNTPGGGQGFLGWARVHGVHEVPIPPALLPPPDDSADASGPTPSTKDEPAGVNVAGYLRAELGVGEVARQVIAALDTQRVPLVPVGLHAPNSRSGHDFGAERRLDAPFDVNLICVNADGLPGFAHEAGPAFFDGRHSIGIWWWELSEFPQQWHESFELVDEIWVGSRFVADALTAVAPVPVMSFPLPVTIPDGTGPDRAALGLPDGFLFLFSFDFNSVFKRKNPLAAIEAFTRAFKPDENVHLVVKSINGDRDPDNHDRLRLAARSHPHVHLMSEYLSAADKDRLTASCDAYVSLHRSEGFGIGMAEALLHGKPVIATGYGGNVDFLDESTGYPVDYELVEVGGDAWPYDAAAHWAEPDVEQAAQFMRRVVEHPEEAARRALRGADLIRSEHSPAAAGARMARRLEAIRAGRPAPGSQNAVAAPNGASRRSRLGLPRRVARRLLRGPARNGREPAPQADDLVRDAIAALRRESALAQATDLAELRRLRARLDSTHATQHETQRQLGELRASVTRQEARLRGVGLGSARGASSEAAPDDYPEAPCGEPWSEEYSDRHRAFVAKELEDPVLLHLFRDGQRLPRGFGVGFDERVVEYPWLAAKALGGTVLDAGSVLNHLHVLTRLRPRMDDLHVVTLAPEESAYPQLDVSYLFADLRDLPIADETYERVLSISTLEHVGMDNDYYGASGEVAEDPQRELLAAVDELRRVLKPGGDLYVTVPVGEPDRFAWVRALAPAEIDELVERFEPASTAIAYYRHSLDGWQLSDREGVAGARYRDHFSSGPVGEDRAVAARALACLHLTK